MKRLLSLALTLATALHLGATVLVYEGFHPADYGNPTGTSDRSAESGTKTGEYTIGVSTAPWNAMNGSQVRVFSPDYGLSLPEEMQAEGYTTLGGAIGLNPASNHMDLRAMNHPLAGNPFAQTSGKLYMRVLMNLDATAATKLATVSEPLKSGGSGSYFGAGFTKVSGEYNLLRSSKNSFSFCIWKNTSSQYNLSLTLTEKDGTFQHFPVLTNITLGKTYLCYVEFDVNAGTNGKEIVRAGAMPTDAFELVTPWSALSPDPVEAEIISATDYPNAMAVAGPYGTTKGYFRADEYMLATKLDDILLNRPDDDSYPVLSDLHVTSVTESSASFSIVVSENHPAAGTMAIVINDTPYPMTASGTDVPCTYTATVSLSANTSYGFYATCISENGNVVPLESPSAVYTGALSLSAISDADEDGPVSGIFRITRADSASDLAVNLADFTGTATEGQAYETVPRTVIIPAGESFVQVEILPLVNHDVTEDTTVTATLAAGNYILPTPAPTATIALRNLVLDEDVLTWIAPADGLASVASNWHPARVPTATDDIVFDGRISNASCTWDETAPSTVASWTQQYGFSGTNILATVFPGKGDFTCFTVTGAMTIDAGLLSHPQSWFVGEQRALTWEWVENLIANEKYRIRLDVGSLSVGTNGAIDASGMGTLATHNNTRVNAAHGGRIGGAGAPQCYGDPKEPIHIGLPDRASSNWFIGNGGGAIYITSTEGITVDGAIKADSAPRYYGDNHHASGAAGSVYLQAPTVTGTGTISAYGSASSDGNYKGTGGRVAIHTTTPVDRTTFTAITADCERRNANNSRATRMGGAGTVVFIDNERPNGLLVIGSNTNAILDWSQFGCMPHVTADGDWTFDAIEFGYKTHLIVPTGTTLTLPDGLGSCYGTQTDPATFGGIRYEGGTLALGDGPQTISDNWMFIPWSNTVFTADVSVENNACIGFPAVAAQSGDQGTTVPRFGAATFTVLGDLTVAENASLRAVDCGVVKGVNDVYGELGILGTHTHGGRALYYGNRTEERPLLYRAYDSVFAPALPGCSTAAIGGQMGGRFSGGVITATITGTLTLNGEINVSGSPKEHNPSGNSAGGVGGSINLTAGALTGSGTIEAEGGSYAWLRGPGGRIAVKLTNPGASFDTFSGSIQASGRATGGIRNGHSADTSAGSVYLQTAAEGDKAGTLLIAMREGARHVNNTNTTEIASTGYGSDPATDFRRVKVVVRDYGRAAVNTNLHVESVSLLDSNSYLDLEGHALTTTTFFYPEENGSLIRLAPGSYTAADLDEKGLLCVLDSSTGKTGSILVLGDRTLIILR